MKIIVCIKSVIANAPEAKIKRTPDITELNPFDRPALEVALQLVAEHRGNITALSMGPQCAANALYEALAMGADRAVLVCDPALSGSDTLVTSAVLAAAIKNIEPFDLILFGTRTADSDTGQVGPQTAVLLDLPLVTGVSSIEIEAGALKISRRADGFRELFEVRTPAVLTVHPTAVQPRDLPLSGIEDAYGKGEIDKLSVSEIGLSDDRVGEAGSKTLVTSMRRIARERKCEFIGGTADEQADELVSRLLESGLIG